VTEAISEMDHTTSWLNKTVQLASTAAMPCRNPRNQRFIGESNEAVTVEMTRAGCQMY